MLRFLEIIKICNNDTYHYYVLLKKEIAHENSILYLNCSIFMCNQSETLFILFCVKVTDWRLGIFVDKMFYFHV